MNKFIILTLTFTYSIIAAEGPSKGFFINSKAKKCWYKQKIVEEGKYFTKIGTSINKILTFDNSKCMDNKDISKQLINNVVSRWHGNSDVRYKKTSMSDITKKSSNQKKGYCVQSTYENIAFLVDYKIKGKFITSVLHTSAIQGCHK